MVKQQKVISGIQGHCFSNRRDASRIIEDRVQAMILAQAQESALKMFVLPALIESPYDNLADLIALMEEM